MGARAVVGTIVVVGLLAGGAVVADVVIRDQTEDRLATELQQQIPGLEAEPDVTIHGFPFLTQVAAGELGEVTVTAPAATLEGIRLEQIDVQLEGVSTDQPTTARQAHMTAFAPLDGIAQATGLDVPLTIEDDHLVATVEILNLPIKILMEPQAAGRDIEVNVVSIQAAVASIDPDSIPGVGGQLDGLKIPVEGLPEGLELTDLRLEPDGVRLAPQGTDVVFEPIEE